MMNKKLVSRDRVHIILFDDFVGNTELSYRHVLEFLDIEQNGRKDFKIINENKVSRFKHLTVLADIFPETFLIQWRRFKGFLGKDSFSIQELINKYNNSVVKRTPLSAPKRTELVDYFYSDITKLEYIIGRKLETWKKYN